jgi:HEAT repeat protein
MLEDTKPEVQVQGAIGLSLHGPGAAPAVPRLVELLESQNGLVRQNAALALCKIGPEAEGAVPALRKRLSDPEWAVRRMAAMALGEIGGASAKAARPDLEKLKRGDSQNLVRKAAAQALERLDKKSKTP